MHLEYKPTISDEDLKFAETDIGETVEVRDAGLVSIMSWLNDNPDINADKSVLNLLRFLRTCKFDIDRTKDKIKKFYQIRFERVEWYENRSPLDEDICELLRIGAFLPLRVKDDQNRQIVIIRTGAHNPKFHKYNDIFKVGNMILDYLYHTDESLSIYGISAYFDMRYLSMGHALQMTPALIKHAVQSWEAAPARIKRLEFLYVPSYVVWMLNIFRSLMSAKLKSRMFLSKASSKEASKWLPTNLGGEGESYESLAAYWRTKLEENCDFFKHMDQFKTIPVDSSDGGS